MDNHMGKQGIVSVFLGVVPGKEKFANYLREAYSEGSPMIAARCSLWDDLGVAWLDHDSQDAHYQGDIPVLLDVFLSNPISYLDSFRTRLVESCASLGVDKVNAGIFLFDYEYPSTRRFPSPYFQFVGCFTYTISTPKWLEDILNS